MRGVTVALAALALAVLMLATPQAWAAGNINFNIEGKTFTARLYHTVYNASTSIPANGSVTINITTPKGWNASDVDAVLVVAKNVSGEISLSAYAGTTQVASATIVPLSTGYTQTLPPDTTKITLSATNAATAQITVYVVSNEVKFELNINTTSVMVPLGGTSSVTGTLKQVSGPPGQVWAAWSQPSPLKVNVLWDDIKLPASEAINTTGAGWSKPFRVIIDATNVTQESNFAVQVAFYYDEQGVSIQNSTSKQLVAQLSLTGDLTGIANNADDIVSSGNLWKYAAAGIGILVIAFLGLLLLGGKKGRRGAIKGEGSLILLLFIFLAAIGASLAYLRPEMAMAALVGLGAFAIMFALLIFGKIKISR